MSRVLPFLLGLVCGLLLGGPFWALVHFWRLRREQQKRDVKYQLLRRDF